VTRQSSFGQNDPRSFTGLSDIGDFCIAPRQNNVFDGRPGARRTHGRGRHFRDLSKARVSDKSH
jgi:hypothetical protein